MALHLPPACTTWLARRSIRLLATVLFSAVAASCHAAGQTPHNRQEPSAPHQQVSLKDRLITGLRATRQDDIAYCERVAEATRTGSLPAKLVDSTYFWAINRQAEYPLPGFAKALAIQCQRLGITWP